VYEGAESRADRLSLSDHRGHPLQVLQDDEGRHPVVNVTMNALEELRKLIEEGDADLLRTMVKQMAEALTEPKPTPSVAPRAASATRCAPTAATAIAAVPGTRAPARSSWRCPACVAAAT